MKNVLIAIVSTIVFFSCTTVSMIDGVTLDRMPNGNYQGNIVYGENSMFCKIVITGNNFEEFGSELKIPQKDPKCLSKGSYAFSADKIIFTQSNTTIDPVCEEIYTLKGEYFVAYTEFTLTFWREVNGTKLEYILAKVQDQ